jgi:hypothetical protein
LAEIRPSLCLNGEPNIFRNFFIIFLFFLAVTPAVFLGYQIYKYGVNFIYLDQWQISQTIRNSFTGRLTFAELMAQHNESRKFFPRLIFIALAHLTHWNTRSEMFFTFGLACLVALGILRLGQKTTGLKKGWLWCLFFASNLLVFSPVQYENWFWGIQLVVFLPIACVVACELVACSSLGRKLKLFFYLLLGTVSTFSFSNGLLCHLVVLFLLYIEISEKPMNQNNFCQQNLSLFQRSHVDEQPVTRRVERQRFLAIWAIAFFINLGVYFYGYRWSANHFLLPVVFFRSPAAVVYFLSVLGSSVCSFNFRLSVFAGGIIFFSWLYLCWKIFFVNRDNFILVRRGVVWFLLGWFSLVSLVLTVIGRLGFRIHGMPPSRYTSFAIYFFVSWLYLLILYFQKHSELLGRKTTQRLLSIGALIFLILFGFSFRYSLITIRELRTIFLRAKTTLLFINLCPKKHTVESYGAPFSFEEIKKKANELNVLGLINPPLITSNLVKNIAAEDSTEADSGYLQAVKRKFFGWEVRGGAFLSGRREPADGVILTKQNPGGPEVIFELVFPLGQEVPRSKTRPVNCQDGYWWGNVCKNQLRGRPFTLRAWAFDAEGRKAYKLKNSFIIKGGNLIVKEGT